jgi:hypothetical protein
VVDLVDELRYANQLPNVRAAQESIESSKVGRANDELHSLRLRLSKLEGVQMKLRRALRNEVITSAALMEAIQDVLNV